jgi:hypothetical protein
MKSFGCVSAHSVLGFRVPSLLHPNEPSLVGDPGFHPNKPSLVEDPGFHPNEPSLVGDPGSLRISAGGSDAASKPQLRSPGWPGMTLQKQKVVARIFGRRC